MFSIKPIKPGRSVDTLVLSLDFDGCTDTSAARHQLINFIVQYCAEHPHYTTIAVAIGSLRQFVLTDFYNAQRHCQQHEGQLVSCSLLLEEFTRALAIGLKHSLLTKVPQVKNITMLTSDILNDLDIGETLKRMRNSTYLQIISSTVYRSIPIQDPYGNDISQYTQEEFEAWYNEYIEDLDETELEQYLRDWSLNEDDLEDYKQWRDTWEPFTITVQKRSDGTIPLLVTEPNGWAHQGDSVLFNDTSKITTLYILHHFILNHIRKAFDVLHFDDKADLLDHIDQFYHSNPGLLPRETSYRSVEWNSLRDFNPLLTRLRSTIQGTGNFNPNFDQNIKEMVESFFPITCPPTDEVVQRLIAYCYRPHAEISPRKLESPESMAFRVLQIFKPVPIRPHAAQGLPQRPSKSELTFTPGLSRNRE